MNFADVLARSAPRPRLRPTMQVALLRAGLALAALAALLLVGAPSGFVSQVAKMALALLAVTAVAFVLLRGLARTRAELPEPELRIVERAALNARNHLALIDVGGHRCLIAYGDTFVQRLDEGHELALHRRTRTPAVSEELQ